MIGSRQYGGWGKQDGVAPRSFWSAIPSNFKPLKLARRFGLSQNVTPISRSRKSAVSASAGSGRPHGSSAPAARAKRWTPTATMEWFTAQNLATGHALILSKAGIAIVPK